MTVYGIPGTNTQTITDGRTEPAHVTYSKRLDERLSPAFIYPCELEPLVED